MRCFLECEPVSNTDAVQLISSSLALALLFEGMGRHVAGLKEEASDDDTS